MDAPTHPNVTVTFREMVGGFVAQFHLQFGIPRSHWVPQYRDTTFRLVSDRVAGYRREPVLDGSYARDDRVTMPRKLQLLVDFVLDRGEHCVVSFPTVDVLEVSMTQETAFQLAANLALEDFETYTAQSAYDTVREEFITMLREASAFIESTFKGSKVAELELTPA